MAKSPVREMPSVMLVSQSKNFGSVGNKKKGLAAINLLTL